MIQETKWPAPSYSIDDLVRVKELKEWDAFNGVERSGIYRVIGASDTDIHVMTPKGKFIWLENDQVERWGE